MQSPLTGAKGPLDGSPASAYGYLALLTGTFVVATEVITSLSGLGGAHALAGAALTTGSVAAAMPVLPITGALACGLLLYQVTKRLPRRVLCTTPDVKAWRVFIGRTYHGRRVYHDFARIPHAKVGGATGSGKTIGIELLLGQLIATKAPEELDIIVIDMKGGASFAHFSGLPHVRGRIYADAEAARDALSDAVDIMQTRLVQIRRARAKFQTPPTFPRLLIVIDEGGELSPAYAHSPEDKKVRAQCMGYLSTLARVGREPCVSILYGTQRPSDETLPVSIRGQMDATLAYRTQNELDSHILLRNVHAAEIRNIKGRLIYQTPDGETPVQGGFIPAHVLTSWIRAKLDGEPTDKGGATIDVPTTLSPSGFMQFLEG